MRALALVGLLVLGACTPQIAVAPTPRVTRAPETDVTGTSYWAAERLLSATQVALNRARPILVASLVEIDDLERSSTLGRLISEQAGSRLAQMGYTVHEAKLRDSLVIRERQGEMILSRDLAHIGKRYDAQAVFAGTYAVGRARVFIDLRLIRASDGRVIASFDYTMPLTPDVRRLIDRRRRAASIDGVSTVVY